MIPTRWTPLRDSSTYRSRFDRLFDETFRPAAEMRTPSSLMAWNPVVDIYDTDEAIVIKADLPGIDKEGIAIDVKDRVLTIRGERSEEKEVKKEKFYRRERVYGKFQRAFTLPEAVDAEKIAARFKDGVLKIEIPKPEKIKPKQITVH
jgi:HSP20 family protein